MKNGTIWVLHVSKLRVKDGIVKMLICVNIPAAMASPMNFKPGRSVDELNLK